MESAAERFLRDNGLHADTVDFDAQARRFAEQMRAGLRGEESGLPMLPTYVDAGAPLPRGKSAVAIDAGGTNLRVALVRFGEDGRAEVVGQKTVPMPGSRKETTARAFFAALADYAAPLAGESEALGFGFSFPCEILPNRDGRILRFCKEVRVSGGENAEMGASLNEALLAAGQRPKRITVVNDTLAGMLAGIAAGTGRPCANFIGLICGTGLNMCYCERTSNIVKLGLAEPPSMAVNTECGMYAGFARSACDEALDAKTGSPGDHQFEKMAGGAYLGPLALECLRLAAEQNLFDAATADKIFALKRLESHELDRLLEDVPGSQLAALCGTEGALETMRTLCGGIYDRAAKLMAVAVFAVVRQCGGGRGEAPVCIFAEGSTFYRANRFQARLEGFLAPKCAGAGLHYVFQKPAASNLVGAAAAALM